MGYWALGSPTREPYNFRLEWVQALFFGSYEVRLHTVYGVLGPGLPHLGTLSVLHCSGTILWLLKEEYAY
jgi:hypothetical protein